MSIFGNIMSKIFGHADAAAPPSSSSSTAQVPPAAPPGGAPPPAPASTAQASTPAQPVDVEAVLTGLAAKNPQKLNWQTSIVDLMKLLDLDSSLHARTELAQELHYTGDTNDTATMNLWLQKQVMQKLAENGGKGPDALRT